MPIKPQRAKKPYRSPRLVRYGDLKTLTAGQVKNKSESGGPNSQKTKAGTG
jgi:hypothetical protein